MRLTSPTALALAALLPATTALSQTLLSGDHSVDGNLCAGSACTGTETFGSFDTLKLDGGGIGILFNDTGGSSTNDWRLQANDTNEDSFSLQDVTGGTTPFKVLGTAPDNSLFISADGNIGLGTIFPEEDIHIEGTFPAIRLKETPTGFIPAGDWKLMVAEDFFLSDITNNTAPIIVRSGAPNRSLLIESNGNVALGAFGAAVPLHVRRDDGSASILVENTGGDAGVAREMFKMSSNGGSFFTLANTGSGTEWFFVHENASPNRFIITDGVADGPEMTLTADGILTVEGGFVAASTTLNVPDYVFAEDYVLRPLAEVASFIAENSHLPEVPSAAEIAETGLDMTQMQMTLLKKVEELTLYTIALEDEARVQRDTIAHLRSTQAQEIADLRAMISAL